jgi:hypothetical protein
MFAGLHTAEDAGSIGHLPLKFSDSLSTPSGEQGVMERAGVPKVRTPAPEDQLWILSGLARRPTPPEETDPQDQKPYRQQEPGDEGEVDHGVGLCGLRGEDREEEG